MEPFRFARGRRRGITPRRPVFRRARSRWRLAGWFAAVCLTVVMAGWPAMLPAPHAAGSPLVLTAIQGPQARILNPGPPTGLTATAGNGQVTLSWRAPAADGGAAIIGYDVYEGTSSGGESGSPVNSSLITTTSYTATGLTNGSTYYFTADAVNDADLHSARSTEASATPVAPATAPGAPTGLSATAGDAQVTLAWKAPASDGGEQITGYNVYEGTSANFKTTDRVASSTGTSVTVMKLTDGTTYYFKVTAVNGVGEGPASGAVSAAPAAAVTAPGAPGGLTATGGHGQVMLTWTAPASTGGAAISGYIIYRGTSPGGESASPVNSTPLHGTSDTMTGLTSGTTYYFKVAAVNAAKHQGKDSNEASATPMSATSSPSASASASQTPSTGPTGVAGIPGAPSALTATPGNAEARLSWSAPASDGGSPLVSYRVYQGTSSGFALTTPVATVPVPATTSTGRTSTRSTSAGGTLTSSTDLSITVTHLTNGTTYYFKVAAVDADGNTSGLSNEASAQPSIKAILTSRTVPKPVIFSLAAVAVAALVAAAALAARRLRPRSHTPAAPPSDVRAVPDPGQPPLVSIHEYGTDETYTVRLEPLPAAIITTLEEIRS
jgi:predicted phage tail protein